jgi:hypothetical protein
MNVLAAVMKVEKRLGKKMCCDACGSYWVVHRGQRLSFFENGSKDGTGSAVCIHVQGEHEESHPEYDHFAGFFCENIERALEHLEPRPAKFASGSLVRVKTRARKSDRCAGFIGIVIEVNSYKNYRLNFGNKIDIKESSRWFNECDLEKVKS